MSVSNLFGRDARGDIYERFLKPSLDYLRRFGTHPLALPGIIFLFVAFYIPILIIGAISFQTDFTAGDFVPKTLDTWVRVLSDSYFHGVFIDTITLGIAVALTTIVISYPVAYHITRIKKPRKKTFFFLIILIPYLTSVVVRTFGWLILLLGHGVVNTFLGYFGINPVQLVNNWIGIYIGLVHVYLPIATLSLMTSLGKINPNMESAARDLGASRLKVAKDILIPLSGNGIMGAFLIVFALAASAYTTPRVLGGTETVMSTSIETYVGLASFNVAGALAILLMVGAIAVVGISNYIGQSRMEDAS